MVMKECLVMCLIQMFICVLTWLLTVLHTYVSRLWVSGGADKDEPWRDSSLL